MRSGPYSKTFPERAIAGLVTQGILRLDPDGSLWRLQKRKGDMLFRCTPKRIDFVDKKSGYWKVRASTAPMVMTAAQMARVVWQVHKGDIPDRLTVNHKDGNASNNALDNLELATHAEQHLHRFRVLKREPPTARINRLLKGFVQAATIALDQGDLGPLRKALEEAQKNPPRRPS